MTRLYRLSSYESEEYVEEGELVIDESAIVPASPLSPSVAGCLSVSPGHLSPTTGHLTGCSLTGAEGTVLMTFNIPDILEAPARERLKELERERQIEVERQERQMVMERLKLRAKQERERVERDQNERKCASMREAITSHLVILRQTQSKLEQVSCPNPKDTLGVSLPPGHPAATAPTVEGGAPADQAAGGEGWAAPGPGGDADREARTVRLTPARRRKVDALPLIPPPASP
jgi:hypothetical protein